MTPQPVTVVHHPIHKNDTGHGGTDGQRESSSLRPGLGQGDCVTEVRRQVETIWTECVIASGCVITIV